MYPEELCWAAYQVGRVAGRGRLKGITFTAIAFSAMTLHWIMMYVLMYALAGVVQSDSGKQRRGLPSPTAKALAPTLDVYEPARFGPSGRRRSRGDHCLSSAARKVFAPAAGQVPVGVTST